MKRLFLLVLLLPIVFLGCSSLGDSFLVQKLDNQSKSKALTDAGIEEYDLHIVHHQEFDQIPKVKEYFTTALRFDPTNTQAQQYISLIDNYKNQKLKANLNSATRSLAKPKRTEEDNYALSVSLQTAARIDPANASVQKMLGDTAQDRAKLVDAYLARSKAALSGVDDKTPDAVREKQYIEAYQNANRALTVDPKSSSAQGQVNTVKAELAKSAAARGAAVQKLVGVGKFTDARTQLSALNELNRKMGNVFEADVKKAGYSLNYAWARALYSQKEYATADVKVDAALMVSRTDEAAALKKKIVDLRGKAEGSASFDASLQEIDRLIGSGEMVAAHRKILALTKITTEQQKLDLLDDREGKIMATLKDTYDKGVQAYRDEDFKAAIDQLQTVVGIQVDYEQAGEYLDKARSKQKLLEQF